MPYLSSWRTWTAPEGWASRDPTKILRSRASFCGDDGYTRALPQDDTVLLEERLRAATILPYLSS